MTRIKKINKYLVFAGTFRSYRYLRTSFNLKVWVLVFKGKAKLFLIMFAVWLVSGQVAAFAKNNCQSGAAIAYQTSTSQYLNASSGADSTSASKAGMSASAMKRQSGENDCCDFEKGSDCSMGGCLSSIVSEVNAESALSFASQKIVKTSFLITSFVPSSLYRPPIVG